MLSRFRRADDGSVAVLGHVAETDDRTVQTGPEGQKVRKLYVEEGLMRFVINLDAVKRSGLNLSSRLLGLATLVCDLGPTRMGVCSAAKCSCVYVDTSPNRSRARTRSRSSV